MVTAQDVFVTSMVLMDEETEDGTYSGYPDEYKKKAWPILTLLQTELLPFFTTPTIIAGESSILQLDDRTCRTTLPYGLAAHLLMNEDQSRAAFFNARYDELKRKHPPVFTQIEDIFSTPEEEETGYQTVIDGGEW